MRSTCFGARAGRSAITTWPLVVSRISVLSLSAMELHFLAVAPVEEIDPEHAARSRGAHRLRERHRRAQVDRFGDRLIIAIAQFRRDLLDERDDLRLAEEFAGALEADLERQVNRTDRAVDRRRIEATAQRRGQVAQTVHRPGRPRRLGRWTVCAT